MPSQTSAITVVSDQMWWTSTPFDPETNLDLRWPNSIEVYDRMRREDAQVMSVLRAVMLPIRRTKWRIDGTGCRPEVVQDVADNLSLAIKGEDPRPVLRTRDRFSWQDHLRLALLQLVYGHSFFEQVYRFDELVERWRIRKLAWIPPRTIQKITVAPDGGLKSIEQHPVAGIKSPGPIPVERLVGYVNDREGGNWLGQSLLRPAYKFWLLKDRALRVESTTLERNGLGIPVFTAGGSPEGMKKEDADAYNEAEMKDGLEIAKNARSGELSGVALRRGASLAFKGVDGRLPDADSPRKYYDEQIARAVLAHFLNLGSETGSWALGSTFADFFTLSLQTVAAQIADITNQHVIEDLVDANWGDSEPAPRLVFDEIGSRNSLDPAGLKALADAGLIQRTDDLEAWIRDHFDLPAIPAGTEPPLPEGDQNVQPAAD